MNPAKAKKILDRLLYSVSTEEVEAIIREQKFSDDDWKPYGNREKNWDTVSNQQTSAVGALTDLITNSILEPRVLSELAKKSILIGVKRKRQGGKCPTITVVDFGEGQNSEDFPKTFLSLSKTTGFNIKAQQCRIRGNNQGAVINPTSHRDRIIKNLRHPRGQ